jgi:hypothetical protein
MPPKKAQKKTKDTSGQPPKKKVKLDREAPLDASSSSILKDPPSTSQTRSSVVRVIDQKHAVNSKKPKCLLLKLPNELIANVLSWTAHPLDILSLSLTCKTMHTILTDESANFMWKSARENFMMITGFTTKTVDPKDSPFPLPSNKGKIPFQRKEPIWTHTPIPDPLTAALVTPAPTEAQFAQLLFGFRPCQNCSKKTKHPPFSVNTGVVLCSVGVN